MIKDSIVCSLCDNLKEIFNKISENSFNEIEEIRFRVNKPIIIIKNGEEYFLSNKGLMTKSLNYAYRVNLLDINETLELMSDYSIYAFEDEIKNGFITLKGGHRVGIVGKTILSNKYIKTIRYISGLNIRVSHQIMGCADDILPYILKGDSIHNTIIVSPPKCGKTTILRDAVRILSNGIPHRFKGMNIGVVDERSEIASCYRGIPQNDIGMRTDVLDSCPKTEGMLMLLRSMAPDIIVVDEIGKKEDIYAIEEILNAGVKIIATVHGSSLYDIKNKPILKEIIENNFFERAIILNNIDGPGTVQRIIDIVNNNSLI